MEYRYFYDSEGIYIGGRYETDPPIVGWDTYTLTAPPSLIGPSIDYPDELLGIGTPIERWDFSKNDWYVPFTLERLKRYRDRKINIIIEYNNGTKIFDIFNSAEASQGLSKICSGMLLENDNVEIAWKNLNGTYVDAAYSDLQALFKACYQREQECRMAERAVLSMNDVTPYTDLADASEDFDIEIGE